MPRNTILNFEHAVQLVKEFPEAAIDLIARTCDLQEIVQSVQLGRQKSERSLCDTASPKSDYKATSPTSSRSSVSPPSIQRYPVRPPHHLNRTTFPPTPASTASSGRSPVSKRPEYIIVAIDGPEDDPIREHTLSVRKVSAGSNVIREEVVRTRLYDGVTIEEIPDGSIYLQHPSVAGGVLQSSEKVLLTWRRPLSHRTKETWFHLVSNEIEADVLLGCGGPVEGSSQTVDSNHAKDTALTNTENSHEPGGNSISASQTARPGYDAHGQVSPNLRGTAESPSHSISSSLLVLIWARRRDNSAA